MFMVKMQEESIVYNRAKNRYVVSSVNRYTRMFKDQKEMVETMSKYKYEYKPNIDGNRGGWIKIVEIKPVKALKTDKYYHKGYLKVCTGMVYATKES